MIRTVRMTEEEYENFQHVKGLENTLCSTITQMKLQQKQAKELAENVIAALGDAKGDVRKVDFACSAAVKALSIAHDVLT